MMEIVIAAGGMPFGPRTHEVKSLGGSEQAALSVAQELRKRGHIVTIFTQLPPQGAPDYFEQGSIDEAGVRWLDLGGYGAFVTNTEIDLLIVSRDPRMIAVPAQAKKKVLWCHDIATHRGMQVALDQIQWTFDEIWAVSEFHRQQIHKVTGYPLSHIVALRNGIVPVDVLPNDLGRMPKSLLYAARPERGLENLIAPGGVMEHLSDYTLYVAMYEHFPEHMRAYYESIMARMKEMPNVRFLGGLTQPALREWMQNVEAYIYPTQFEETSCIIARECIERRTPFLTTREGALPETLGDCGIFYEDWVMSYGAMDVVPGVVGSEGWRKSFANFVRMTLEHPASPIVDKQARMSERTDLYWDGVAEMMERHAAPRPVTPFSRAWSLLQDGDVIAAKAILNEQLWDRPPTQHELRLEREITDLYPFIPDYDGSVKESLASYYQRFYSFKQAELRFDPKIGEQTARYQIIADWLRDLPSGSCVVEYGCGEGHILGNMALRFPHLRFIGFDHVQQNVDMVNAGAKEHNLNIRAYKIETPADALTQLIVTDDIGAAVICSEVLEHNVEPWTLATDVEKLCRPGGRMIFTTPYGAWEPQSFTKSRSEWFWRNHIWCVDKWMLREMFRGKEEMQLLCAAEGMTPDHRSIGQNCISYKADHTPIKAVSPLEKGKQHHARQTCAAAIIACNNESTILHMLHSIATSVQFVQIALGPSTDNTQGLIRDFFYERPHIGYNIVNIPQINPAIKNEDGTWTKGYGFDDARNASIQGLEKDYDWILWVDTDEYLVGDFRKYLRSNALDSYMVCQHHFTTEPAGAPAQVDRPARLFRTTSGFKALGKIHEHFVTDSETPGRAHTPQDVHIGHTGYKNEMVRRGRFERNFPFLVWDHEVNPNRKLHKYLWFRDIVHRMRYYHDEKNFVASRALAEEAVRYYNAESEVLAGFGGGGFQALSYRNEAYAYLGRGVAVKMSLALDDRSAPIEGLFESYEEAERMIAAILKPEFERRRSKYY
jgi:2-polyprenyl-3-methyl-5-hydroxy-6-metoxy-1,4-benzoquinol methylase